MSPPQRVASPFGLGYLERTIARWRCDDDRRMNGVRTIGLSLLDLVLPVSCALCGRRFELLCATCVSEAAWVKPARRLVPLGDGVTIDVWSAFDATADVLRLVTMFKDSAWSALARPLVAAVPQQLRNALPDWCIPIPQTARAFRRRGWHPLHRLATALGMEPRPLLSFSRTPGEQSLLDRRERDGNLRDSMRMRRRPAWHDDGVPQRAVIFDDIVTTGATIAEAARTLMRAGVREVSAFTLAAVPRWSPSRDGKFLTGNSP